MIEMNYKDYLVGQLLAGKVNDFYSMPGRKNIAKEGEPDQWIEQTSDEVMRDRIDSTIAMASKIADIVVAHSLKNDR